MVIASNPVSAHDHEPHNVQAAVQRQEEGGQVGANFSRNIINGRHPVKPDKRDDRASTHNTASRNGLGSESSRSVKETL